MLLCSRSSTRLSQRARQAAPRRRVAVALKRLSAMQRFYVIAVLLTTLSLVMAHSNQTFAASPNAAEGTEEAVPQGKDPPGNDNEDQSSPTTEHKGVIEPPPTGDQGIYTQVPNPNAGTKKEVIPPPGTPGSKHPNVEPR
jgi:hypothetical protein